MLEEFSFKGWYSSLLKIYVVGSIFLLAYFVMGLYPLSLLDPYISKIEKLIPIKGPLLMMIMAMPFALGSLVLLFFIGRNLILREKKIVCTISTDENNMPL